MHQRVGYCAVTSGQADCSADVRGSFSSAPNLAACVKRCQSCSRCSYVSFSTHFDDCSWYSSVSKASSCAQLARVGSPRSASALRPTCWRSYAQVLDLRLAAEQS